MSILTQLTRKKLVVVFVGYCLATLVLAAMMYYLIPSSKLSFLELVGVYSPVGVFIALMGFYNREKKSQKPIK